MNTLALTLIVSVLLSVLWKFATIFAAKLSLGMQIVVAEVTRPVGPKAEMAATELTTALSRPIA